MAFCRPELYEILALLLLLTRVSSPVFGSKACEFPAVFNFGDSNSDTGGLSAAFGQPPPPYGESFFHAPAGRYSDGRLIIDFIAISLGLPYLNAYLDSLGTQFTHGVNFATAASTIRRQNTTDWSPFSLDVQLVQYNQFVSKSQSVYKRGGVFKKLMPKKKYFSQALYTFDIGQNDLTAGYYQNMTTEEVKATVPDLINHVTTVIKDVYGEGGRFFWVHNTGPFGCLPYVLVGLPLTAAEIDKAGCGIPFNEVAQHFNKKLKEAIVELRKELPLTAITYVDIYSLKYSLISHANKYGFEHPLQACCGHGGKYNFNQTVRCGGKITVNGTQVLIGKSCKDPSVRINWDGVHYTQAANQWVFNQIVNGAYSDPPLPLKMACHREAQ